MRHYHFSLEDSGTRIEYLGRVELANDEEALSFGQRLVRDLHENDAADARWSLSITEGGRAVASIPLDSPVAKHQTEPGRVGLLRKETERAGPRPLLHEIGPSD